MRLLTVLMLSLLSLESSVLAAEGFDFKEMQARIQATIEKTMPAVVSCGIKNKPGGFSAVIVTKDGYVLTAAHCVFASKKDKKVRYELRLSDGRTTKAEALGYCDRLDCALMKITEEGEWPFVEMGDSSELVQNQPCVGISHPGGHNKGRGAVVRFGRIKEVITPIAGMIQSTCRIEPGDSGGPVFDLDGKVIGINSQIRTDLTRNYQVAINTFHEYWKKLERRGSFNPSGTPGVPEIGLRMRNTSKGIVLTGTRINTIAREAKLKKDDRITQVNKRRVMTSAQLVREYIRIYRSGAMTMSLTVKSGEDEPREVVLKLPERKERTGEPIAQLENLIGELEQLEDELDDTIAVIVSQQGTRPMSVYGTRISDDGLIVSKSSQVGDDEIFIKRRTGELLASEVVARDEKTDLVLLRCSSLVGPGFVALNDSESPPPPQPHVTGRFLLSPNARGEGCVSVIGSNIFSSVNPPTAMKPMKVFVGAFWRPKGKPVRIVGVAPKSPAAKAGVKVGDVLLRIGLPSKDGGFEEKDVKDTTAVANILRSLKPNDRITLTLKRNGAETVTMVKLLAPPKGSSRRHAADFLVGGKSDRRTGFQSIFTHDATLQQKECGGPVFDPAGEFVGLNIARHSRAQFYAVPADVIRKFVADNLK